MPARSKAGAIAALALLAMLAARPGAAAESLLGRWLTEDAEGVVAFENCGATLCGRIVGLTYTEREGIPLDYAGRSECGLVLVTDVVLSSPGNWAGRITDPRNGREYRAQIWIDSDGRLNLRGYIGLPLFGRTVVWEPHTGRIGPGCRFTATAASRQSAAPVAGRSDHAAKP